MLFRWILTRHKNDNYEGIHRKLIKFTYAAELGVEEEKSAGPRKIINKGYIWN